LVRERYTLQVSRFLGSRDHRVTQLLVHDAHGRFSGEPGCAEPYSRVPRLDQPATVCATRLNAALGCPVLVYDRLTIAFSDRAREASNEAWLGDHGTGTGRLRRPRR
jgi:hypothetical protein